MSFPTKLCAFIPAILCFASLEAHAFSSLLCRNDDQSVVARLTFDGNGTPLVAAGLFVHGQSIPLAPDTIRPGKYPMRHTGKPMLVGFVGYQLALATDDSMASVTADGTQEAVTLTCCDPVFPRCATP